MVVKSQPTVPSAAPLVARSRERFRLSKPATPLMKIRCKLVCSFASSLANRLGLETWQRSDNAPNATNMFVRTASVAAPSILATISYVPSARRILGLCVSIIMTTESGGVRNGHDTNFTMVGQSDWGLKDVWRGLRCFLYGRRFPYTLYRKKCSSRIRHS